MNELEYRQRLAPIVGKVVTEALASSRIFKDDAEFADACIVVAEREMFATLPAHMPRASQLARLRGRNAKERGYKAVIGQG